MTVDWPLVIIIIVFAIEGMVCGIWVFILFLIFIFFIIDYYVLSTQ